MAGVGALTLTSRPCCAAASNDAASCQGVNPIKTDIVIIGAGAAGIRAAARVLEVDPTLDVTILESTRRIGGRVESNRNFGDTIVQKGANWIYDDGNAIFELAVNASLSFNQQNFNDLKAFEYDPSSSSCSQKTTNRRLRKLEYQKQQQEEPAAMGRLLRALEDDDSVDDSMKLLITRFLRRELDHHDYKKPSSKPISKKGNRGSSAKKGQPKLKLGSKKGTKKKKGSKGKKTGKKGGPEEVSQMSRIWRNDHRSTKGPTN